jgi:hypothetical protein
MVSGKGAVLVFTALAVSAGLGNCTREGHAQTQEPAEGRRRSQVRLQNFTSEQRQLIDAAVPSEAPAKPKRPRRLLVMDLQLRDGAVTKGPSYFALPAQNYALEQMGKRTGAYEVVVSRDVQLFRPGTIDQFDPFASATHWES